MANTTTGIIRRIDDLGRVVIPRELRRTLGIREGDPFEISIDRVNHSVTFTQYCPMSTTFSRDSRAIIGAMMHTHPNMKVSVYDAVGNINTQNGNMLNNEVNADLVSLVEECRTVRRPVHSGWLAEAGDSFFMAGVVPVIIDGDFLGFVLVSHTSGAKRTEQDLAMFESAMKSAESLVDFVVKTQTL